MYLGFPSGTFFRHRNRGCWLRWITLPYNTLIKHLLHLIRHFLPQRIGVLYWGFLIGFESLTSIWCSTTFVHLKSFSSSSWNTWTYFISIGSVCRLSSKDKWSSFPGSSFSHKTLFFHFLGGLDRLIVSDSHCAYIFSISDSKTFYPIPRTVCLGTVSDSILNFASITYAVLGDRVTMSLQCDACWEDWRLLG